MKVVAREKNSDKLELVVVKPDSKDGNPPSERDCELEEKLGIELYGNFPRIAKYYGNTTENLNKISTATLSQKAVRPPKTGFILDKAINELGYNPHSFEECLTIIDQQLKQ